MQAGRDVAEDLQVSDLMVIGHSWMTDTSWQSYLVRGGVQNYVPRITCRDVTGEL